MKKILLIFSKRLGDTLFYTPALQQLRQHHPNLIVDVVALSTISGQAMQHNPVLRNIFIAQERSLKTLYDDYDRVLSMHDGGDIREYIGSYDVTIAQQRPAGGWANYACQFLAEQFNYKVEPTGKYLLYPQAKDEAAVKVLLAQYDVKPNEILMGLHMGNFRMMRYGNHFWKKIFFWRLLGKDSKSWPFDRCVKIVERLHKQHPEMKFVLTGAPGETFLASYFKKKDYVVNLIGQTSVLELAALMKHFKVFLTGDTGPLHVACAMDTPLVTLFGKTHPDDTGPHPKASHRKVIYRPAMDKITVDEVERAIEALIKT